MYFEFAAYFALLPLLIAAGAMPSAALFLMPVILPALYVLFRRFGACLPVFGRFTVVRACRMTV